MESLAVENLSFTYPDRSLPALENISLQIQKGEFVTLCGKSGCGKTTLLREIKPMLAPYGDKNGVIRFCGADISLLSEREQAERIGFVLQNPDDQIVCDKVWHELSFGLESLSFSESEIRARVAEMASYFGIGSLFYKNVHELSGGQKQLINLASVMVMQPELLLLDEPTSSLDPIAAHDFLETVSKINKELGVTVLLSEHRLEEALPLSDKVIVLDKGKMIADGDVKTVGEVLKQSGNDMMLAFPTPMKVYYSVKSDCQCPITVREGRRWLEQQALTDVDFEDKDHIVTENNVVLKANDLWFRYEKNSPDVLKGFSLKIYENQLYAIVGGNGAGKTTALSVLMGLKTPYRGSVIVQNGKRVAALPQNLESLFVRNTVREDLWEMLEKHPLEKFEKQEKLESVVRFFSLAELLNIHPYDLSGGEKQRVALAKVLLSEPDILLLDEPTKGLDAHFKQKLAELLGQLKQTGMTIVMISHDIEFCAEYADRVGLFFDGMIVSENSPRAFFNGKSFYTTAANRMAREIIPGAVLAADIIAALGGTPYVPHTEQPDTESFVVEKVSEKPVKRAENRPKAPKRTVFAAMILLFMIPFTVFAGMTLLEDRKYYFTSLAVMLEAMLPFVLVFEGRKPKARQLVSVSVLCALAVVGRVAFSFVPQFKPVTALVIISGLCLGSETGFLVGAVTGFVSNFYFSQGPWTPWQMFAWGLIGFVSGMISHKTPLFKSKWKLCIFGFSSVLVLYGGIMNPVHVMMSQTNLNPGMLLASYMTGFPLDLVHAASTAFFLWFMAEPMCEKLERVKVKYGIL